MRAHALDLREYGPHSDHRGPPVVAREVEGAAVGVLSSAYRSWAGRSAEAPTSRAIADAFEASLTHHAVRPEWDSIAATAFTTARARLDATDPLATDEAFIPYTQVIAAIATPRETILAWMGVLVATVIDDGRFVRQTHAQAERGEPRGPARVLGPTASGDPLHYELARWPALARGQRLLLCPPEVLELLPTAGFDARGEAWLRALVSADPRRDEDGHLLVADRAAVLLEPPP